MKRGWTTKEKIVAKKGFKPQRLKGSGKNKVV